MPHKETTIKIRLSGGLKAEIERVAKRRGESLSVIAREALRRYIVSLDSSEIISAEERLENAYDKVQLQIKDLKQLEENVENLRRKGDNSL